MMRSLYSGVAGLKTHQTKMDVIGNNIANVNTTSFKSQSITFSDLMYQTTQTASGATETKGGVNARQIGLGAKSGAINTAIESQGATQTTNNPFDIMITGKAFFIVNNGTENLYTRDGSFYVDGAGNLAMQSNGYFVQGWVAQEDKDTGEITINKNGGLSALQIMSAENATYSPASTTAALYSGNIDDNDPNILSDDGKTITLEFYDNKGYLYTGKFTLKDTATDHLFALTLTDIIDSNGKTIGKDLLDEITFGTVDSESNTTTKAAKSDYTFATDATGSIFQINAPKGDVKYDDVPNSADGKNSLSDIMSTSSKKYKGLLNAMYGVSTEDEKTYGNKATYLIDSDPESATYGRITISYPTTDIPTETGNGNYDTEKFKFVTNSTDRYFVNQNTKEAYLVPNSNGKASSLTSEYLNVLFGINSASGFDYDTDAANYNYTFDSTSNTLALQRNLTLEGVSSRTAFKTSVLETASEKNYFVSEDDEGRDLTTAIDEWIAAGTDRSIDNITYTYNQSAKKLTIYTADYEVVTKNASIQTSPDDDTADNYLPSSAIQALKKAVDNYNTAAEEATAAGTPTATVDAENLSLADLAKVATFAQSDTGLTVVEQAGVALCATTIPDLVNAKIDSIKDSTSTDYDASYISDPTNPETFNLKSLSGTSGIKLSYSAKVLGTATAMDEQFIIAKQAEGTLNTDYSLTSATAAKYIYKGNVADGGGTVNPYQKAYCLGNALTGTFTDANIGTTYFDILKNVFDTNGDIEAFLAGMTSGVPYSITFGTDGTVSIAHTIEAQHDLPSGSEYKIINNGDGTIDVTSTSVYADVPGEGNISDLLRTSSSNNADLLYKIYGITDEEADAYGTDGTYKITSDGSIKLTMGEHSIQLEFDAADGSLVRADTSKFGLVTMNFNQNIAGLEAFGYQEDSDQHEYGDIQFDLSTLTNYNTNGSSTIKAVKGDKKSLNTGRAVGEMNGVSVSTDGRIYATYSNGQTKLLGQIASAEFANASGLSKEGDNLYSSTLNSGEATIQDITTDGGYMNTGVLEMSNVDLSSEFTEMITTQRGFQANSRIITVSDTLLEELTNLKR